MSAFCVSKHHIDLIITAAIEHGATARVDGREETVTLRNADAVGRMLWSENVRSVCTRCRLRYSDQDKALSHQSEVEGYRFTADPDATAGAAAKALDCYEYQTCEGENYTKTEAAAFVDEMRRRLVKALPGYVETPSGIDAASLTPGRRAFPRSVTDKIAVGEPEFDWSHEDGRDDTRAAALQR